MDYLSKNETINNSKAREVTHIKRDHQVKAIFGRMVETGMIRPDPWHKDVQYKVPTKQECVTPTKGGGNSNPQHSV